jgi:hypothetical protein
VTPEQQDLLHKATSSLEAAKVLLASEFPEFASNSQYGFYLIARASMAGYCLKSTEVDCAVTSLDRVGFEPISMGFIH